MAMMAQKHPHDPTTLYLYNLGYAHSHPRAANVQIFSSWIKALVGVGSNLFCYTNDSQTVEREYLKEIGFETYVFEGYPRMNCHFCTKEVWEKYVTDSDLRTFLERKKAERAERLRQRDEAIANGTYRNRDGSIPRRRGELRVGDRLYSINYRGRWINDSVEVSEIHDNGEVTVTFTRRAIFGGYSYVTHQIDYVEAGTTFRFRPVMSTGYNIHNYQRVNRGYW